jgi:lysosomal alpha-mannosidase
MNMFTSCAFLLLGVALCFGLPTKVPTNRANACGYDGCNLGDPTKLNVHIVPHTHDDVGWLKTVDQYYYGARNNIQHAGVQYIIDSVVRALDANPDRRFIYVEIGFFWRWWNEQSDVIRNKVKGFVNSGQLEFISGGWCMNDEASTHYNSIIDQHSLGAEFLRDVFGDCARPKIGWQIDPFGHSREQASLEAQMGYDGLFFGRADYQDIDNRTKTKNMETIWKASANLDQQSWLFTGVLPNGYSPPGSFCYDAFCSDPPIMDDPRLHDFNVPERVQSFIQAANNEANNFATNHIIMTMGSDFQYENANEWFKNMDKLIKYVNAQQSNGSNVNVFYSTPSCYLYALNKVGRKWSSKTDDFFPYAHHPHGFWTGYFTSRPAFKRYERYSNNILQVTRQLNALSNSQLRNTIFVLSEAMGVSQHHDAVSGTEKQEVVFDYAQRLSVGIDNAISVISQSYSKLLPLSAQSPPAPAQFLCQVTNISECVPIQDQARFTVTLWNPTVHPVIYHYRVPVTKAYTVRDSSGQPILAELLPVSDPTKKIPGRNGTATNQLVFRASLPALGFSTYFFEVKPGEEQEEPKVKITENDECILLNQNLRVEIDAQGNLQHIVNLVKGFDITFSNQGFYWYQSFPGNNSKSEFQASGAYIFRPLTQIAQPVSATRTITCIKAETVQKAIIVFNDWASQEISLYDDGQYVEVEWTVGPIPIGDNIGKEIIVRYDTNIQSQAKFYTDANGREVLERTRNYRPTWNYTVAEPVSGNYYPVNSRIYIKEANRQLTVLTDRSEGGSSITDGSIEIMVHRRILNDDALGVGEALSETAFGTGLVVRGRHFLIAETPAASALLHRVGSQRLFMNPLATYALIQQTYADYSAAYRQTWSSLTAQLPLNLHLLTLDQLDAKNYLVRVEHYFELNEDANYSQPITFDLQSIFQSIGTINNTVELTLGANLPLANLKRLEWNTDDESSRMDVPKERSLQDTNITLKPMQIRTFTVTVA